MHCSSLDTIVHVSILCIAHLSTLLYTCRSCALLISRHYCTRVDLVHCSSLDTIVHVLILCIAHLSTLLYTCRSCALLISRHYCTRVDLVHCSSLDTIVHVSILSFPCSVWYIVVCPFVLFSLSVLRFTDSDYPFCICKPFLPERKMLHLFVDYN